MDTYSFPNLSVWGAVELEDLENLVDFAVPAKQGSLLDQLGEYAANCPDVDS